MNPDLQLLQPYPFEKLTALKAAADVTSQDPHIALSIGEPKHPAPEFVLETLKQELQRVENYPTTKGLPELNQTIADWLTRRFKLQGVDASSQVIPVNGTREAIFAFTQAAINRGQIGDNKNTTPLVVCPNPFYQIYEGAAYLSGATPHFLSCDAENGFNPDFTSVSDEIWQRCQLLFVCTPGNPTGSTLKLDDFKYLLDKADEHNFIIASDECYSEIYIDTQTPPLGLLEACTLLGRHDFKRCVVFHSLSKRSNLPGLRSGFIAGDANCLKPFLLYRTYHGCAMPVHTQLASIAAWGDEKHVEQNRAAYTQKFSSVLDILQPVLNIQQTEASFYLWPETPINEELFAQRLFAEENVTVLPGSYLSRTVDGHNPGANRIRMALVASVEECTEAALRIRRFVERLR